MTHDVILDTINQTKKSQNIYENVIKGLHTLESMVSISEYNAGILCIIFSLYHSLEAIRRLTPGINIYDTNGR